MVVKTEVQIRQSRYADLVEHSKKTGVSVEELVDRALSSFIDKELFVDKLRAGLDKKLDW